MLPVIIIGTKTLGRSALEIFKANEVMVYGFLSDSAQENRDQIEEVPILGNIEEQAFLDLIGKDCVGFVAVENGVARKNMVKKLAQKKSEPINAIHPSVVLSASAIVGGGNLIDCFASFGQGCHIGDFNLIQSGVRIAHEATLDNYIQVGTNSVIGTGVKIKSGVFIGSGAVIIDGVTIEENARIGAGSVVIESVKANETVLGNPAKVMNL